MDMGLLLILMVVLAVFAVSAAELGVDSRDEVSDDPHRSNYPVGLV